MDEICDNGRREKGMEKGGVAGRVRATCSLAPKPAAKTRTPGNPDLSCGSGFLTGPGPGRAVATPGIPVQGPTGMFLTHILNIIQRHNKKGSSY